MMLKITKPVHINAEDIDDILCTAFEGGITYWCNNVQSMMLIEWHKENHAEYASEVISRGGDLVLSTEDGDKVLTLEAFLKGLQMVLDEFVVELDIIGGEYYIDTTCIDADLADVIVQYALFGELVYS